MFIDALDFLSRSAPRLELTAVVEIPTMVHEHVMVVLEP